jgi:hypothetical protein
MISSRIMEMRTRSQGLQRYAEDPCPVAARGLRSVLAAVYADPQKSRRGDRE